jgi:hypothetical protein
MKKLWCAISLSLLLNVVIGLRLARDEKVAFYITDQIVQAIMMVNFKVEALAQ